MHLQKVEMNNKLKAFYLLEALNIQDSLKHDILTKADFKREPEEVYVATKAAIKYFIREKPTSEKTGNCILSKAMEKQRQV